MSKSRRELDTTSKPAPGREPAGYVPGIVSGVTLAGVLVLVLMSYMNWQETRAVQRTVEARLGQMDGRRRPPRSAAPTRAGCTPSRWTAPPSRAPRARR